MKLFKITFLMTLCLYLFINHVNLVNSAFSISVDRSNYIQSQLDRRSNAVTKEMGILSSNINTVLSDSNSGIFSALSTTTNTLSGLFGMLNYAIPCGGAAIISSAVLGVAQIYVQSSQAGDVGYTIAQGVKALVRQDISSFNTQRLVATIKGVRESQANFYLERTTGDIYINALLLEDHYVVGKHEFELTDYQLDSIGLYTLFANSHLLFLYDMVVSGGPKYGFSSNQTQTFINKFKSNLSYYRSYINSIDAKGIEELENYGVSGKSNQDEWNIRNDYYNYMKLFVYDISNYWDYLDPVLFPNGVFIENAHVSLSNLFGAPYNRDNHMSNSDIDNYLNGKNVYQYQGKLTGVWYKNVDCDIIMTGSPNINTNLVKYFGGRQYLFREGVERDSFYLGDTGSTYPLQYKGVDSLKSFLQYNARDRDPTASSRDYHWGLSLPSKEIGNTVVYKTRENIQYPQKVVALALPLSYNLCSNHGCSKKDTIYLVESAVMGFVNDDVSNNNIVFELTSSMIDAQKYNYIYPPTGYYYSRDGYRRYKHSMYIPANTYVTYKIEYNPYNKLPGTFKLFIDFANTQIQFENIVDVYYTRAEYECLVHVISKNLSSSGLREIGDIKLNPSSITDNFVSVKFSKPVYFQHLTFKAIE